MMGEELQTLSNAMDVLMLIGNKGGEARASELESELAISRSSLYRIVGTLRKKNFIEQAGGGVYRLGFGILSLGLLARGRTDLEGSLKPILTELARQTGETAMLTAVSYPDAVCVARAESTKSIRLSFEVGLRMPMCAGASGKVLLMGMADEALDRYLNDAEESGILHQWKATKSDILEQIQAARDLGWLSTLSEVDVDAFALGVPVYDSAGVCRYGLSIAGPVGRFEEHAAIYPLKDAASRISEVLSG